METCQFTRRNWLAGVLGGTTLRGASAGNPWKVHPEHPRLFFRRTAWGKHGLTLGKVRARGARFAKSLQVEHRPDPEAAPDWAMLYVVTGDASAAQTAIKHMRRGYDADRHWTTTQGDQIEAIAIAYDWLRGTDAVFPESDRRRIEQTLLDGARGAIRRLGEQPSIYHTRMYAWANAVLFAGLALWGERREAGELVDFGIRYWKERLIPARRHLGGAWFNAMSYGQKYMCRSVFSMLTAWHSATGENLWALSRRQQGDWAGNMLYYLMYQLRPDYRFATYGDIFNSMANCCQGTMRLAAQATAETRDPYGQGFLQEIREHCHDRSTRWESRWYRIFFDPAIPARPRSELPLSRLFGRDSIGMAVMRSGWGPGDTWVLFKCGDYGDNHGHFDQGHFEIFHKGQLAMDSYYGSKTTMFHNTILVNDPRDPNDRGEQRKFSRQIHGTLESYLADPVVRTGDILDYRVDGATTYVLGDVTPAYDRTKVRQFTRQVVFVERRCLVIFDVVIVATPRLHRRFLIHYPTTPKFTGQRFSWVNGGGQLIGETILPRQAKLTAIPVTMEGREPSAAKLKRYWPAGRVEVEPESYDSTTTVFLHLLSPVDAGQPPAKYTFRQEPDRYILTVAGKQLMFASDGRSCRIRSVVA